MRLAGATLETLGEGMMRSVAADGFHQRRNSPLKIVRRGGLIMCKRVCVGLAASGLAFDPPRTMLGNIDWNAGRALHRPAAARIGRLREWRAPLASVDPLLTEIGKRWPTCREYPTGQWQSATANGIDLGTSGSPHSPISPQHLQFGAILNRTSCLAAFCAQSCFNLQVIGRKEESVFAYSPSKYKGPPTSRRPNWEGVLCQAYWA